VLFNSYVFLFLFLPVTYGIFWMLPRASWRYIWLAITGYVFYGYWNPWFCFLMAFSTLVSYTAGLGFLAFHTPTARRLCLVVPITVDLLLLGFFKYANFGLETAQGLLDSLGLGWRLPTELLLGADWKLKFSDIILPVGISFYTFHTISYIVDAYRGVIKPTRNIFEFAAYVSLFSQLVAGPIVRFRQIEEDLENLGSADRTRWLPIGVSYFVLGFLEKVLLADTIAAFIDPAFQSWRDLSTAGAWLAVLGYTFQLYFDFSGYSSMAIGLGYLFGLRIPINFNSPYKATDPSDFWRRWHISLSSCLRDYVYIPLGGNRGGELVTYRNLLLTMLIGGLWHGANWNFVLWGAYHGLLLALYRAFGSAWDRLPSVLRQLTMFALVMIGWVFFRTGSLPATESLDAALRLLHVMFVPAAGVGVMKPAALVLLLAVAAFWAMKGPNVVDLNLGFQWHFRHTLGYAAIFGASLAIIAGGRNSPFLYFQF
jgi:alginate O-acetyltransferase complex protein AlgI